MTVRTFWCLRAFLGRCSQVRVAGGHSLGNTSLESTVPGAVAGQGRA
jgi:hypothetical protein